MFYRWSESQLVGGQIPTQCQILTRSRGILHILIRHLDLHHRQQAVESKMDARFPISSLARSDLPGIGYNLPVPRTWSRQRIIRPHHDSECIGSSESSRIYDRDGRILLPPFVKRQGRYRRTNPRFHGSCSIPSSTSSVSRNDDRWTCGRIFRQDGPKCHSIIPSSKPFSRTESKWFDP